MTHPYYAQLAANANANANANAQIIAQPRQLDQTGTPINYRPVNSMPIDELNDWYQYSWNTNSVVPAGLLAGTQANVIVNIESDSEFTILSWNYFVTEAIQDDFTPDTLIIPPVTINMIDNASNRSLMIEPIFINNFASNIPGLPGIVPGKRILAKNSNFTVVFDNQSSTKTYKIQLVAKGYKSYNSGRTDL